jgi:uncharacterized protein
MLGWFDPMYLLFVGPAILLALYAQMKVKSAYHHARGVAASSGLTGAQAAAEILSRSGVPGVHVEEVEGFLSDHYDPKSKVLRLSPEVYHGRSIASLGIAAHEAGHALQDGQGYMPLVIRNGIVPLAAIGGNISWVIIMLGFVLASAKFLLLGILLFGATVVFQLVNLPVEFDASKRARALLQKLGMVRGEEDREVGRVLNAAALTYVAATLSSVLTLAYYLMHYFALSQGAQGDEA